MVKGYVDYVLGEQKKDLWKWLLAAVLLTAVDAALRHYFGDSLEVMMTIHGANCFFMGLVWAKVYMPIARRAIKREA